VITIREDKALNQLDDFVISVKTRKELEEWTI